jgi:hypothetical protein
MSEKSEMSECHDCFCRLSSIIILMPLVDGRCDSQEFQSSKVNCSMTKEEARRMRKERNLLTSLEWIDLIKSISLPNACNLIAALLYESVLSVNMI